MKTNEIQAYTTSLITQQLQDGFTLEWDDTSHGYKSVCWLRKDDVRRCLCVKESEVFGGGARTIEVFLFEVSMEEQWVHEEDHQPQATFYQMGEDWYTTDAKEAAVANDKNMKRYRLHHDGRREKQLELTDKALDTFRNIFGLDKIQKKNLRITRSVSRSVWSNHSSSCYKVVLLNRLGNVKETRTYQLGAN